MLCVFKICHKKSETSLKITRLEEKSFPNSGIEFIYSPRIFGRKKKALKEK